MKKLKPRIAHETEGAVLILVGQNSVPPKYRLISKFSSVYAALHAVLTGDEKGGDG